MALQPAVKAADQTYDATSTNAQSGVAVSEAIRALFFGPVTLGGNVLTVFRNVPTGSIRYYCNSNKPTERPSGRDWGSYLMIKSTENSEVGTIFYWESGYLAFANVAASTTSLTWAQL